MYIINSHQIVLFQGIYIFFKNNNYNDDNNNNLI